VVRVEVAAVVAGPRQLDTLSDPGSRAASVAAGALFGFRVLVVILLRLGMIDAPG
jgi:hypothetical protein